MFTSQSRIRIGYPVVDLECHYSLNPRVSAKSAVLVRLNNFGGTRRNPWLVVRIHTDREGVGVEGICVNRCTLWLKIWLRQVAIGTGRGRGRGVCRSL